MPAPIVNVDTAHRDQVQPNNKADLLAWPGRAGRQEDRLHLRRPVANPLLRRPKTGATYCDPLFGAPDIVENDYYRFRHQPRS